MRAAKMRGVIEVGTAMIAMWERVCNAVEKHRSRTRSSVTRVPCRSVIGVVGRRSRAALRKLKTSAKFSKGHIGLFSGQAVRDSSS